MHLLQGFLYSFPVTKSKSYFTVESCISLHFFLVAVMLSLLFSFKFCMEFCVDQKPKKKRQLLQAIQIKNEQPNSHRVCIVYVTFLPKSAQYGLVISFYTCLYINCRTPFRLLPMFHLLFYSLLPFPFFVRPILWIFIYCVDAHFFLPTIHRFTSKISLHNQDKYKIKFIFVWMNLWDKRHQAGNTMK